MKESMKNVPVDGKKSQQKTEFVNAASNQDSASGRWTAKHRTRLPHKVGVPLSSSGGGDSAER